MISSEKIILFGGRSSAGVSACRSALDSSHRAPPLGERPGGGACVVADQREPNHQGRWRPRGPRSLAVRPAPPLVGPQLGAEVGCCSALRSMRRSSRLVWRASPTVGRPPHTQRRGPRGTSVSDSTGEATRRRAAPSRAGKTATAAEVSVVTQEWGLHVRSSGLHWWRGFNFGSSSVPAEGPVLGPGRSAC